MQIESQNIEMNIQKAMLEFVINPKGYALLQKNGDILVLNNPSFKQKKEAIDITNLIQNCKNIKKLAYLLTIFLLKGTCINCYEAPFQLMKTIGIQLKKDIFSFVQKERTLEECSQYSKNDGDTASFLYLMSNWHKNKIIYEYDNDFLNEVIDSNNLSEFSQEILYQLPFNSMYIIGKIKGIIGILVYLDNDTLHFCLLRYQDKIGSKLLAIMESVKIDKTKTLADISKYPEYFKLLLYLCTYSPDIKENLQKENKKTSINSKIYTVGFRYGSAIRSYKIAYENNKKTNNDTKRTVKPHMRRGHFAKYWTGKRDSEDRKVIIKWISPVMINADYGDIPEINIHKIKK